MHGQPGPYFNQDTGRHRRDTAHEICDMCEMGRGISNTASQSALSLAGGQPGDPGSGSRVCVALACWESGEVCFGAG